MNGPSRFARTEVVAQAAALQPAALVLDRAPTLGAPRNERYTAQRPTTKAGTR
ncbi:hypothetical protein [Micromonospora carbonacea]|uniref:Uncharacterized protein n=1 Tax=Micromonospora carbonacea TaxID=47853 RepID=A0A1C5AAA9_9ACTN|nr:hypothetical protein [Micromonospora carbonacea]SCF42168.1 hypothetical protein GA0070563_11246 [Micromonospora carbonacea]